MGNPLGLDTSLRSYSAGAGHETTSRGGSHAAETRAWEPALLQNFHLLRLDVNGVIARKAGE